MLEFPHHSTVEVKILLMLKDPIVSKFLARLKPLRSKLKAIYLFGSRAKGTERPDSDYDVLLVVKGNFSPKDKDRIYDAVMDSLLETGRLISLKIFKEKYFEELASLPTPFMKHVLTEGVKLG